MTCLIVVIVITLFLMACVAVLQYMIRQHNEEAAKCINIERPDSQIILRCKS